MSSDGTDLFLRAWALLGPALLMCACAPSLAELQGELPVDAVGFDLRLLDGDRPGQLAAAERLCHPLADTAQRALGFELARRAHAADRGEVSTALLLARCAYFRAEEEQGTAQIARLTAIGIEAAMAAGSGQVAHCLGQRALDEGRAISTASPSAALSQAVPSTCPPAVSRAAYQHALLIGLRMRVAGMREALALLDQELALLDVARLAAEEEQGGPLRVLAMIYLKAPAWPAGPGDLDLALELLEEAAARFPSHPLNRIFLAAALLEDGQADRAKQELAIGLKLADETLWGKRARAWRDVDALVGLK